MITVKEQAIGFNQYRHTADDPVIHIFVSGFEPSYDPIVCVRGEPATMPELVKNLEKLLGVRITLATGDK
jgi:hypothetical protein